MMEVFDITIIGGGSAGLFSSFYSGLHDMKTKIIEYQPSFGGKMNVFLEKMLWDVGGQPPINTKDFLNNLVEQGTMFAPTICLNTKANYIDRNEDYFIISTNNGEHYSKTVLLAMGAGTVNPIKLDIDDAAKFEATNLHYEISELELFRDKEVIISGGGNAAVDWAVELLPYAKKITIIYRGDELKALEAFVKILKESEVEILLNAEIKELHPSIEDENRINNLIFEMDDMEFNREVDDLVICYGHHKDISIEFSHLTNPSRKEGNLFESIGKARTTVPGIFVAGDIASYDDRVGLFVGAFQDAILAVDSASHYINPGSVHHAMVSTHNEKFFEKNKEIAKQKM